MMGFYPDCPGVPEYTLTLPAFDRVTIKLNPRYYGKEKLVIEVANPKAKGDYIKAIRLGGKKCGYRISHRDLINAGHLSFEKKP